MIVSSIFGSSIKSPGSMDEAKAASQGRINLSQMISSSINIRMRISHNLPWKLNKGLGSKLLKVAEVTSDQIRTYVTTSLGLLYHDWQNSNSLTQIEVITSTSTAHRTKTDLNFIQLSASTSGILSKITRVIKNLFWPIRKKLHNFHSNCFRATDTL